MTPQEYGIKIVMEAAQEHDLHDDIQLDVHLNEHEYTVVIAALQLAMRNPNFKRMPSYGIVRQFVDRLIFLCPENRPVLRKLLEMGDNQKFDTPSTPR